MQVIEELVCYLMGKLFSMLKITDIDKQTDITYVVLGYLGFIVETGILIGITFITKQWAQFVLFFVIFGLSRIDSAEHYDVWIKCMCGTTTIYLFYQICCKSFSGNFIGDILWCLIISLLFRKWDV